MSIFKINPLTAKRWRRFRSMKRAWWSFVLLVGLYVITLGAELICNDKPLIMRFEGRWYFPLFRHYSESEFIQGGRPLRADYPALDRAGVFDGAFVLWAPVRNDPYRIVDGEELREELRHIVRLTPEIKVAGITVNPDWKIIRCSGMDSFMDSGEKAPPMRNRLLTDFWHLPPEAADDMTPFWQGEATDTREFVLQPCNGSPMPSVRLVVAGGAARNAKRKTVRARLLENRSAGDSEAMEWNFAGAKAEPMNDVAAFAALPESIRSEIAAMRNILREGNKPEGRQTAYDGRSCTLTAEMEEARFPFRPVSGHWMGIDDAGRDVFARIFYGLRLALNFGTILVFFSLAGGSFFGILQGYMGGKTDMIGQRLIEIWSAMPFLYVMILMGSIYGTGFVLLLVCYALFNWIGISYFMRAETLRLRRQPFVEAAQCMGLSGWKIAWKHILPNALVPLVTFFPFSLVGAIGSLAALDYLGFGLPVPSPSLGELMAQGQVHRWAWWLIFFPAAALFIVMLLGVMVGEGIRNAFDPRRQSRLQ